jgi:hypothetical protein
MPIRPSSSRWCGRSRRRPANGRARQGQRPRVELNKTGWTRSPARSRTHSHLEPHPYILGYRSPTGCGRPETLPGSRPAYSRSGRTASVWWVRHPAPRRAALQSCLRDDHARPVRPPLPRLRKGGGRAPRQLPRTVRRRGSGVRVRCTCAALRCTKWPFLGVERGQLRRSGPTESARNHPANRQLQRRGRDSNPRWTVRPTTVFETAPFNRSGTPPGRTTVDALGVLAVSG